MIKRIHRFHGRGSLRFVYTKGRAVRGAHTSLKYIRNYREQHYRVAIVVSKKVSKSAVVRNRIRRRMYEVVRGVGDRIAQPYDLVFVVYSEHMADMPYEVMREGMMTQLEKARVLTPGSEGRHGIVEPKENVKRNANV